MQMDAREPAPAATLRAPSPTSLRRPVSITGVKTVAARFDRGLGCADHPPPPMNTLRHFLFTLMTLGAAAAFIFPEPVIAQEDRDEEELGEFFDRIPIPAGMSKEDIQDMLAKVFLGRGWTVEQKTDRRVVGHLVHGGAEATVTMRFGGEAVEIYSYGWDLNRRGERVKPFQPTRWLRYLRKDLQGQFDRYSAAR